MYNGNKFKGGIPAEWGSLTNIKKLNVMSCGLGGKIGSTRSERFIFATEIDVCAGPLPKVLPSSLETLQLGSDSLYASNNNKFEGGIPAEWAGLPNLKKLNVVKCGLGGKPLITRTTPCSLLTRRVVAQFRTKRRRP